MEGVALGVALAFASIAAAMLAFVAALAGMVGWLAFRGDAFAIDLLEGQYRLKLRLVRRPALPPPRPVPFVPAVSPQPLRPPPPHWPAGFVEYDRRPPVGRTHPPRHGRW